MLSSTAIVAYLALFAAIGFLFLFAALLLGRFLRANVPTAEKMETYECGEPPVGPSHVQFNLRFYVIALVFLIFDVEVALFFPWATVFGKANQLRQLADTSQEAFADPEDVSSEQAGQGEQLAELAAEQERRLERTFADLGAKAPELPRAGLSPEDNEERIEAVDGSARRLALASLVDIAVFFGVLLVGFAYVWKQGDLDWVRALRRGALDTDERTKAGIQPAADTAGT